MYKPIILTIYILFCHSTTYGQDYPHTDYVDLFIGTAGDHGQLDPAACVPFGMVKLGPDTAPGNHSGYDYNAEKIKGFSHNRLGGTGCQGAGGNILVKPGIGSPHDRALNYNKNSESAQPGYYTVFIPEIQTRCELTATNYTGFHRYTLPSSKVAYIMIDLKASFAELLNYKFNINGNNEIVGSVLAKNVCNKGAYTQYFSMLFSRAVQDFTILNNNIYAMFSNTQDTIMELQVGLSPISVEQARLDRDHSIGQKSFDQIRQEALEVWENTLGRVEVSGREAYKKLFYTHLYHSCLLPVNSTSTNGFYKGTNGKIYKAEGYIHYDGWSIWDTYRTKLPLITLLYPERMKDLTRSLTDLYNTGKKAWSGKHEPVPTVRTEHALLILLDAYRKGIHDFDVEAAYAGILKEARKLPYKSPDNILETNYDYWSIAQFAKILGKEADHKKYMNMALDYKNIWRKKFLTMNHRSDIMHGVGLYEGTLWQYLWSAPSDFDGMKAMLGGEKNFTAQLEYFFENDLYNHGNQPDIHTPFMFNFGSQPELTQKWVNKILTKEMVQYYGTHKKWKKPVTGSIYKTSPDGYIPEMDDDAGTMSAWFVFAAMGLYPVTVGDPVYQLSTPIFDLVVIHLDNGKTFTIKQKGFPMSTFILKP